MKTIKAVVVTLFLLLGLTLLACPPEPSANNPVGKTVFLTQAVWKDGAISDPDGSVTFALNVSAEQTYYIWWNDSAQGNGFKTLDIKVTAYYTDEASVFDDIDSAWTTPQVFTPVSDGRVFLEITSKNQGDTGTFGIVYNTLNSRPSTINQNDATLLNNNQWMTGEITSSVKEIWYYVIAAAGNHYFWWNDAQGNGSRTLDVVVSAVRSNETAVFSNIDDGWNNSQSAYLPADVIFIKVVPKNPGATGTFDIFYSTSSARPWLEPVNTVLLSEGKWNDGEIIDGDIWYKFNATENKTYRVWWNDSAEGNNIKNLNVRAAAYYSNGAFIFSENDGWNTPRSFTPTSSGIIYIAVSPNTQGSTGTFGIVYTEDNPVRPPLFTFPENPKPIISGVWTDGEITSSENEIWYSFYANGIMAYFWWNDINNGNGTKTLDVLVSVFRSNETISFYNVDSSWNISKWISVSNNERIYIRVVPKTSGQTGSFSIAYNGIDTKPFITPANSSILTAGQWEDGEIIDSSEVWYRINAEGGQQYFVWLNENQETYSSLGVCAYYDNGNIAFAFTDSAWYSPQSFTPVSNGTVYIRVALYTAAPDGTFGIAYDTVNTRPALE